MKLYQTRLARLASQALRYAELIGIRGTVTYFYRRLVSSIGRNGLAGTLQRAVREIPSRAPLVHAPEAPHSFDLLYGTDTGAQAVGQHAAHTGSGFFSWTYGNSYLGIAPSALINALSQLPFTPEDFTFIDLGCGKGRGLMVAAQFGFRQIIGVEISPELCRIAEANIARNPDWATRISVVEQDAAAFTFPRGALVIFLYNPFLPPLLRRALKNLERQLRREPRETWLLYADTPRSTTVLKRSSFLRKVSEASCPLSPEDQALTGLTHEHITLYSCEVAR